MKKLHNNEGYKDINHLKDNIVKQPTRHFSLHPLMTIFCNPLSNFPAVFFIKRLGTTVLWLGVEHGPRPAGSRLWSDDRDCFGLWPQNTQTWSDALILVPGCVLLLCTDCFVPALPGLLMPGMWLLSKFIMVHLVRRFYHGLSVTWSWQRLAGLNSCLFFFKLRMCTPGCV